MIAIYLALVCDLIAILLVSGLLVAEYRPHPRFAERAGDRRPIFLPRYPDCPLLVHALYGALRELEGCR
jgi:hypothetical protein